MKTLVIYHDNKTGCTAENAGTTDYQIENEQQAKRIINQYITVGIKVFNWVIFSENE